MINFPDLIRSKRRREFDTYSDVERSSVLYHFLFLGFSSRELDKKILGLDSNLSRGWQSWGILQFLGLSAKHRGAFMNNSHSEVLSFLLNGMNADSDYALIYCYLRDYIDEHETSGSAVGEQAPDYITEDIAATHWLKYNLIGDADIDEEINERLRVMNNANTNEKSIKIGTRSYHYSSTTLKATVKSLYDYHCQICNMRIYRQGWSPSMSRKTQWNYLNADAHHIIPISWIFRPKLDADSCLS